MPDDAQTPPGDDATMADDLRRLHAMGYAQELARRLGGFSNFALSLSIICILAGGVTSFHLGLCSVGGASIGLGSDGAMAELVRFPAYCAVALPRGVSDVAGALLEPLAVALHALDRGRHRPADRVLRQLFDCPFVG